MRRWLTAFVGLLAAGVAAWAIATLREPDPPHPAHDEASRQKLLDVLREPEP